MVATWPERGQQAPDYWDGQLKAYVDEMQTLPSRLGDLGLPASGTELSASYEAKVDRAGATTGQVPALQADGTLAFETVSGGGGGTGDVTGPASSTDSRIAAFDGTTGKLLKDGGATIADLATAAQGALADSAVQPGDLGTAAAANTTDFATAAQGTKADSAVQPGSLAAVATTGAKADVGLGNVDNTSDANKPVSTAQQAALDLKAPLDSPTLTGDPKAPTRATSDNDTSIATTAHVKNAIQGGSVIALGSITGSVSLSSSLTAATAVNATVTCTLTGNTTFTAATMPSVAAGTQFAMRITQDGTGSRTLTLTNIRKPGGTLALSTAASAVDLVIFFYDGTNWYASLAGKGFAA